MNIQSNKLIFYDKCSDLIVKYILVKMVRAIRIGVRIQHEITLTYQVSMHE